MSGSMCKAEATVMVEAGKVAWTFIPLWASVEVIVILRQQHDFGSIASD